MFIRPPAQHPLANSSARIAFLIRARGGPRIIEIGDRTVTALILISALLFAWYLVATLYLVMRDDLVISLLANQRRAHYAYEDRIAELRGRIDKITARQLVSQDSMEDRVAGLIARQAELEARQVLVGDLGTRAEKAGIAPQTSPFASASPFQTGMMTSGSQAPLSYAPAGRPRPLPEPVSAEPPKPGSFRGPIESLVREVEKRAQTMETGQVQLLAAIGQGGEKEIATSRQAIAALGLDPARFGKDALKAPAIRRPAPLDELMLRDVRQETASAIGGPLLPPLPARAEAEAFEQAIQRAEIALESTRKARMILAALPLGRPISERFEMTSSYGTRMDPFTRSPALHSGIDFRAPAGTPVRAIAAGRIVEAGHAGGYGRMVEIDHGYGITTRYAHLSVVSVTEGEKIEKGAIIGQVGSTGRSTGPHLHYEVRLDDDSTDPMRFIRAGRMLAAN
ncbi:MAG: peptidoglycan DD-metalloendopeptidase family protein [Proteobacteria bacterium]|nr:peptidoglycan DD-metalloendopeptidase family protein [Pseudomonadota bacterium]